VDHQTAEHQWPDLVQLKFKRGHDTEVSAAPADGPEQVRVLLRACGDELAIRGHDIGRQQIVAGEAVLAHEPAEAATERQARDAGVRDGAARRCQSERLRFVVEFGPGQAGLSLDAASGRSDPHALHG
jgi:hypothetical protein